MVRKFMKARKNYVCIFIYVCICLVRNINVKYPLPMLTLRKLTSRTWYLLSTILEVHLRAIATPKPRPTSNNGKTWTRFNEHENYIKIQSINNETTLGVLIILYYLNNEYFYLKYNFDHLK